MELVNRRHLKRHLIPGTWLRCERMPNMYCKLLAIDTIEKRYKVAVYKYWKNKDECKIQDVLSLSLAQLKRNWRLDQVMNVLYG